MTGLGEGPQDRNPGFITDINVEKDLLTTKVYN